MCQMSGSKWASMKYGYVRTGTDEQTTAPQFAALKCARCCHICEDEGVTGAHAKRPALSHASVVKNQCMTLPCPSACFTASPAFENLNSRAQTPRSGSLVQSVVTAIQIRHCHFFIAFRCEARAAGAGPRPRGDQARDDLFGGGKS